MFKRIQERVWAFDAEWVPDPHTGRVVYDLPESMDDRQVMAQMWRRGGATEEEPRPYLKTVLCRVVSIAMVGRREEGGEVRLHLSSLPAPDEEPGEVSEIEMVTRFLDGVGKHQPQLVGYNSAAADLRILMQRGVAAGVSAPGFARRPDKPWEGVDYFAGSDWHVDLIDILGGRGRGRPSLHEMATACGIPGKFSSAGSDVADLWLAGDIARIVAYNEYDALTTYLLWLRVALFAGFFTVEQYQREQELVEELLRREQKRPGRDHLQAFLDEWLRLQQYTGSDQLKLRL